MRIQSDNQTQQSFRRNVSFMFVMYWGILVLWQNIGGSENRGAFDIVVKIGLLVYFVSFYLRRAKTLNLKIFIVFMLAISLIITALGEPQFTLGIIVSYVYPILLLSMVYGFGDTFEINQSQLVSFCNCIIAITLYAAVYAVVFCWDQFAGALSVSSAYGSELSSFFISNFEYGMYLVASLISCLLCLTLTPNITKIKKIYYYIAIAIFASNLILTFSRTNILGCALFLLIYGMLGNKKRRTWIIIISVIILLIIVCIPSIRSFVFNIVFKENNMSGRDVLFAEGFRYYKSGTLIEKFFGHGINETRTHFDYYYNHGSVHNGYLQVLLYYGIVGIVSLIGFMIAQVIASIKRISKDRYMGVTILGLNLVAALVMVTTTAIAFTSSIDSFFLTMFFILVPKYIRNSIDNEHFYSERKV